MKKIVKKAAVISVSVMLTFGTVIVTPDNMATKVEAHSGRTDSSGGHRDNKNKSGLGSYHYHCGGYPAHLHTDGVCPYTPSSTSTTSNSTSSKSSSAKNSKSSTSKSTIKKVQKALNGLGYSCGKADGVAGKKTKAAVKKYQKDHGLTVDGKIGNEVIKALGIS